MPPVPNKHTSNIFFTSYPEPSGKCPAGPLVFDFLQRPDIRADSESDFYFKFAYNFIVALLAEVKFIQPVVFFREIAPRLDTSSTSSRGTPWITGILLPQRLQMILSISFVSFTVV